MPVEDCSSGLPFHLPGGTLPGPSRVISLLRDAHGIGVSTGLERFPLLARCVADRQEASGQIPYANDGDAPPVRHGIPGSARVPASHAREGVRLPLRRDGPEGSASRPPAFGGVLRHPGALARGVRLARDLLQERNRHRGQDPARRDRGGDPLVGPRRALSEGLHQRLRAARLPPAGRRAPGNRSHPRHDRAHREADAERARVPHRRRRLLRREQRPGVRLSVQAAVRRACAPAEPRGRSRDAARETRRDFVVWKGAKPAEPSWQTPWGRGRPGWHIECSAMSAGYLGSRFDIHGGGEDLIFPHHENERAQSRSAGDEFARYWVHHGLVTVVETKMSKTAGNALAAADALQRVRPQELRYYLGQAHYRSMIEYSTEALEDAAAAYQRIERFVTRAQHTLGSAAFAPEYWRLGCRSLRRRAGRRPRRPFRARRTARHSAGRQLRSKQGGPGERGDLPGAGARYARGARSRPARARPGRQATPAAACAKWWTRWSRSPSGSGKRRGRGATMLRRTPSGTPWRPPGWSSKTRRRAPMELAR